MPVAFASEAVLRKVRLTYLPGLPTYLNDRSVSRFNAHTLGVTCYMLHFTVHFYSHAY